MKRYFTGIAAVVIAVAAMSFTMKTKTDPMHVFEYTGSFSSGQVELLDNWSYLGTDDEYLPCNNGSDKACRVFVTEQDIDNSVSPVKLNSSVEISEAGSGSNISVASISGDGPTSASNRSN